MVVYLKTNDNPLQYSCLENSINRGSWRATVHGFAESDKTEHTHLNRKSTDNILNLMSNTRVGSELPTQPPISPFFRCNLSQFCPELFCTLTHLGTCSGKALSSTCVSNWSKCHSISLSSECFRNRPVSQEVGLPVFLGKVSTFSYSYTKDNFPSLDTVVPGYYSETPASYWGCSRPKTKRGDGNSGPWSHWHWHDIDIGVTQSCPTLCDPMDCSLPGSSIYGIFQARVLEWVAIAFSRKSSQPRDRTRVSRIAGRRFTVWATREATKPISWRIHPTSGLPTVSYPEATLGRGLSTSIQKQEAQL